MYVCPNCGAHLDSISEHCDCEDEANVTIEPQNQQQSPEAEEQPDYIEKRIQEWLWS